MTLTLNTNNYYETDIHQFFSSHYTTIIFDSLFEPSVNKLPLAFPNATNINIVRRVENNTVFYDVASSIGQFDIDAFVLNNNLYHYTNAAIYAAYCLRMLLGDRRVTEFSVNPILPQVEWYVKENETNKVVATSAIQTYIGSPYRYANPIAFRSTGHSSFRFQERVNGIKFTALSDYNDTQFYGLRYLPNMYLFDLFTCSQRVFKALNPEHRDKVHPINYMYEIINSHAIVEDENRSNKQYGYLTGKSGEMKVALLGECYER